MDFLIGSLEVFERDMMVGIEEYRINGRILDYFNSNFIAHIPKVDNVNKWEDYMSISLCNYINKLIAKVIARRVKNNISSSIS